MPREVEFHPRALEEARAAYQWYMARSTAAASAFLSEIDLALARIAEAPDRWPAYMRGTRRYLLRRFPYSVVFRETADKIQVIAVAHGRRRPGYWKNRGRG
jgi:plasmid stabilization system protein ParE